MTKAQLPKLTTKSSAEDIQKVADYAMDRLEKRVCNAAVWMESIGINWRRNQHGRVGEVIISGTVGVLDKYQRDEAKMLVCSIVAPYFDVFPIVTFKVKAIWRNS